jgi:hypothetical protein
MRYIFFLLLFGLLFPGCSKQAEIGSPVYNNEVAAITMSAPLPPKDKVIPQKIIKSASLRFETNDLEDTYKQIQAAVKESHASIQSDSEGKNDVSLYRTIMIHVPSQNFDVFLQSVSKGVSYFDQKDISSEDVTEQYIDLDSRLKTKRKLEERYLEILKKANKISEILEIEEQLKYLESQVSESRISIQFYKPIAEKQSIKISYGSKILTAIKSGFNELSGIFIWIISIWPFIIIVCVLAYFIRKRIKRKKI